jgi:altronate hydrolase
VLDLQDKHVNGPAIRLNSGDNVAVALREIASGTALPQSNIITRDIVPAGYKVAIEDIGQGDPILKYGVTIGFATTDLLAGTMLHSHNVEFREFDRDYRYSEDYQPLELLPPAERATFQGYLRDDGRVGTRNFIAIVSTVNCSATVVHAIADHFTKERLTNYPNVDGVAAFSHHTGCGMEMTGEPMNLLHRTLAGYIQHPNVAASLVVGLGCERCQVGGLFAAQRLVPGERLRTLIMQENGALDKPSLRALPLSKNYWKPLTSANGKPFQRVTSWSGYSAVALMDSLQLPLILHWARLLIFFHVTGALAFFQRRQKFTGWNTP